MFAGALECCFLCSPDRSQKYHDYLRPSERPRSDSTDSVVIAVVHSGPDTRLVDVPVIGWRRFFEMMIAPHVIAREAKRRREEAYWLGREERRLMLRKASILLLPLAVLAFVAFVVLVPLKMDGLVSSPWYGCGFSVV